MLNADQVRTIRSISSVRKAIGNPQVCRCTWNPDMTSVLIGSRTICWGGLVVQNRGHKQVRGMNTAGRAFCRQRLAGSFGHMVDPFLPVPLQSAAPRQLRGELCCATWGEHRTHSLSLSTVSTVPTQASPTAQVFDGLGAEPAGAEQPLRMRPSSRRSRSGETSQSVRAQSTKGTMDDAGDFGRVKSK